MNLSIIIPSYNEGKTLPQVIEKINSAQIKSSYEIIIVDDGSRDNTRQILKKYQKVKKIKIIVNRQNLGKGSSIIKALAKSTGDIILIQDADLEYDPNDIPKLLEPFKKSTVQVVYGSRILGKNVVSHWTFYIGGRLLTLLTNLLYRTNITDEPTGYKVFRSEIIRSLKLQSKGFEFCPEITAKIAKRGIKIEEVPISYQPRKISEKKIRWYDGLKAIYYLIKYRISD